MAFVPSAYEKARNFTAKSSALYFLFRAVARYYKPYSVISSGVHPHVLRAAGVHSGHVVELEKIEALRFGKRYAIYAKEIESRTGENAPDYDRRYNYYLVGFRPLEDARTLPTIADPHKELAVPFAQQIPAPLPPDRRLQFYRRKITEFFDDQRARRAQGPS